MKLNLLFFILIGLGFGLIMKDRATRVFGNLIVGVVGAIPGGYLLYWANLIPHGELIGASALAFIFLEIRQVFFSSSF